ncbi:MAG: helix-turn-helix domain-containing protein [Pseudomonadota bacterium]
MNEETPTEDSLTALQKEIVQAVQHATAPMERAIEHLRQEILALRQGDKSEWMTVKEVAAYLGVGTATVRRRVKDGQYETRRPGKSIMIRRADVVG